MTNKARLILATVVTMTIVLGLLYANHRAARNASALNSVISKHSVQAIHGLHNMQFGVARIVSSINELLVLSASRSGSDEKNTAGENQENKLIEEGNDLFDGSFNRFKTHYKWLNASRLDVYKAMIADIEDKYASLIVTADVIIKVAEEPFAAAKIAELKEKFELREQELLKAIEVTLEIGLADNDNLIVEEEAAIKIMQNQTIVLGGIFILVLTGYSVLALKGLSNEATARLATEQNVVALEKAVNEKDHEMELRIDLEKSLSHSRKLESLGTLASGMAHELNNQLLPVMTMAELVRDHMDQSDPDHRKMELVMSGARNAKKTVSKILEFSRISERSTGVCEVAEVFRATEDVLNATCAANAQLTIDADRYIGNVDISDDDLQGVIINLFSNAVDALEGKQGKVSVVVDVMELDSKAIAPNLTPGKYARIVFHDTGKGIETKDLERVFDPFFTTKVVGSGVGIGLSIVYKAVKQAGGEILVESAPEQGSTFSVYLPLVDGEETAQSEDQIRTWES